MIPLLLLLGTATAEYSVKMPYLNPAGVTYTSYSAAYGPLAYRSYASPLAAGHLVAAPVASTRFAAAPLVAAPTHAVVPVTRYSAQPAVLQNVVDVAHPKVATRRYQIRRPAIQKQFYDIEERVIVRPAGSAVVELEQPVSTNQRGPTEVKSALQVSQPFIRYGSSQRFHYGPHLLPAYLPAYPHAPAPAVQEPSGEYEDSQQQQQQQQQESSAQPLPPQSLPSLPQYFPSQPNPPQSQPQPLPPQSQQPQFPQPQPFPPQFPPSQLPQPQPFPPQFPPSQLPQPQPFPPQFPPSQLPQPQPFPPQFPSSQFPQPQPFPPQFPPSQLPQPQPFPPQLPPSQQQPTQPFPPQSLPPQQQPGQPQPEQDDADSVSIDNPELARSGEQQSPQQDEQEPDRSLSPSQPQPQPQASSRSQEQQSQEQQSEPQIFELGQRRQVSQQSQGISGQPQAQILLRSQAQEDYRRPQPLFASGQYQLFPQPQFLGRTQLQEIRFQPGQFSQRFEIFDAPQGEARRIESQGISQQDISQLRTQLSLVTPRPEVSPDQRPTGPTPLPALRRGPSPLPALRSSPSPQPELSGSPSPLPDLRASPSPQAFLSSGPEEIPSTRNLSPEEADENQRRLIELLTARGPVSELRSADEPIRGRVLSATPAPLDSAPTDSRSNTRRVVVNKAIQTVEEVEVSEPFTKLERVAVHQPAVVKTAHVELAHVPAVHAVSPLPYAAVTPVPVSAHYL